MNMEFISSPLTFQDTDSGVRIVRNIKERITMLDNLIEMIVFTPRGSFLSDPDFGFEYWNHEYTNVNYREFNNGHMGLYGNGLYNEITRKECEDSIRQSICTYDPLLKSINVTIELNAADKEKQDKKNVLSKYVVTIKVDGVIEDGLGTTCVYNKSVMFMMEPTYKKYKG